MNGPPPAGNPPGDPWAGRLEKLAAGFASGIGALGLVIFTGGAVQWLRFDRAGLPADQAVAAIPRNELIAIGAHLLSIYVICGGLGVLLLYLVDSKGRPFATAIVLMIPALAGLLYAIVGTNIPTGSVLFLTAIAAGLILLILAVSLRTGDKFLWLGVSVFLAFPFFGGTVEYLINRNSPQVQPAAVVRSSADVGLAGVYVTINDKRLYIGRSGGRPGLFVFPCSEVTGLAIGQLQDNGPKARQEADDFLDALYDARSRQAGAPKPASENSPSVDQPTPASAPTAPVAKSVC